MIKVLRAVGHRLGLLPERRKQPRKSTDTWSRIHDAEIRDRDATVRIERSLKNGGMEAIRGLVKALEDTAK